MNLSIFTISLYKTCTILAILLVIIRMKWLKNILQKQNLNINEYIIIAIIFSFLGIIPNYLPIDEYGTSMSTIRVIIVSGGILFGPIVGLISSISSALYLPIVDVGCDTLIPEIIGILTAGIVSSIVYEIIKRNKINPNIKWIIGILTGVIVQNIALIEMWTFIQIVGGVESLAGKSLGMINTSMAIAHLPIGIFVGVIQDITYEKQISSLEKLQGELNKAKLEVLQSQINPHFLFNTLNVIGLLAGSEPDKAREVVVMLSKYIRHNLDLNGEFIDIKDEIEQIKCYIYIQKTRFEEKFDIFYDIDESINIKIPSLVMQPLVENALEHGILKDNKKGEIYVSAHKREDGKICISVRNTGIPIDEDIIERLYDNSLNKNSIGLRNVHIRLKTIYGEGLRVYKLKNGTMIEFCIGAENECNYN